MSEYKCHTCDHASHDWCNKRPEVTEAQTECSEYEPNKWSVYTKEVMAMDTKEAVAHFMDQVKHSEFYMATFHHDCDRVLSETIDDAMDTESQLMERARRWKKKAEAGEKLCIALQHCAVKLPPCVRTFITNYYECIKSLG